MGNLVLKNIAIVLLISSTMVLSVQSNIAYENNKSSKNVASNTSSANSQSKINSEEIDLKEKQVKLLEDLNTLSSKISEASDDNSIKAILNEYYDLNKESIENIYFAGENGKFYVSPSVNLPESYDAREREWYLETMKNGHYFSIYEDAATERSIITVSRVVSKDNTNIGVIAVDSFIN